MQSSFCWADSHDTMELLEQENQVFAAARYVQAIAQTPANVTVIARDQIKRFGYRTIQEALASLPGVYNAASQWPALGVRGIAVPGDFGSRILYLVNGMPMYEATYGGFFIEYLDIESIDRIEFIKGAGSALYGSGAAQAVVNLITRSGPSAAGNTVSLEGASHRTGKIYGSNGGNHGGLETFITVSASRSAGRDIYLRELDTAAFNSARFGGVSSNNDGARNLRLFGRVANRDFWLQGLLIDAEKEDPLASYNTVFNGNLELREQLGAFEAGLNRELPNGVTLTARTYLFNVSEKGEYPYSRDLSANRRGQPADYINVSDLGSRQFGMELRVDQFLSNTHHFLAGVEIKHVQGEYDVGDQPGLDRSGIVTAHSTPSYDQVSLFAQDERRFGSGTLFLGARLDSYQGFSRGVGSRVSPRIAYIHELSKDTTGKLIYGEAYRAPTLYESQYQDGSPRAETIWANSTLRPELSRSFEAVLEHQPQKSMQWKISAFVNQLRDTPVQMETPTLNGVACLPVPNSCIQYRNSNDTQYTAGLETDLRVRLNGNDQIYASAVLQKSRADGHELPASPKFQLKGGISHALPWHGMNAALEAHYIGRAHGRIEASGERTTGTPSYLLVNGTINLARLPGGWQASLHGTNLLDRRIYTVASRELQPVELVPAAERQFSLRLQLDF
ncbi:TonB-dependent receptor [Oxalobacteraceae bacterium R-40]|uniref:TonB-dependent receptor n=1 Tax=Keguizhuia sedimenti TaxID=3064264 RepID=A0ABU1BTR7_9BURK|nr:TonB-dependent receptor [Oxalobacteraceae bacterium R-40]